MITRTQLNKVFDTLPPPGEIKTDVLLVPAVVGVVGVESGLRTPFEVMRFGQIEFHKKRWASRPGKVGHDRWVFQGEVCDDEKENAMSDTNLGQELSEIIEKQKNEERSDQMSKPITGQELMLLLEKAIDMPENCRRVIIDCSVLQPVVIYTEQYGDERLLKVDWSAAKGLTVSDLKVKQLKYEASIAALGLSLNAIRLLDHFGVLTIGELIHTSRQDLLGAYGATETLIVEIGVMLGKAGHSFCDP